MPLPTDGDRVYWGSLEEMNVPSEWGSHRVALIGAFHWMTPFTAQGLTVANRRRHRSH